MAINKDRNVSLQITIPIKDYENLKELNSQFLNSGIRSSKSEILVQAFREYLRRIIAAGQMIEKQKEPQEAEKEKKDA